MILSVLNRNLATRNTKALISKWHSRFHILKATNSSTTTAMACAFDRLPPELRDQIFRPLCVGWDGKVPNLIKALRPNTKLYYEALDIFYRSNTFTLHRENDWSFGDMSKKAVLTFTKITVKVSSQGILRTGLFALSPLWPDSTALTSDCLNIRELTLVFPTSLGPDSSLFLLYGSMSYHFNYFIKAFEIVDRINVIVSWIPSASEQANSLDSAINIGNRFLKSKAKLMAVAGLYLGEWDARFHERFEVPDAYSGVMLRDCWFWQAEKGCHLRDE